MKGENSKAGDMWSVGVILYLVLSGTLPFWGEKNDLIYNINRGLNNNCFNDNEIWEQFTNEVKDILLKLICVNPNKRLTANECLNHEWFKKIDEIVLNKRHEELEEKIKQGSGTK